MPLSTTITWGLRLDGKAASAALWAPSAKSVRLVLQNGPVVPMQPEPGGWHTARPSGIRPGDRYMFEVDGAHVSDPASNFQPDGPETWSETVALDGYAWRCPDWTGRAWQETVLYELHVGTFSAEGTFLGAIAHLDHLARLGVTMVELMPVATFPGARNWGYDGVLPFAPDPSYGTPSELQRLVDECHLRGLSIVLDVVYNHFGPRASSLGEYAPEFFTERHETPWGPAINFDGGRSDAVRAFYLQNARQWVGDYRFDGLRIDAVQAIFDESEHHILRDLSASVRERAAGRHVHLMLENDLNESCWLGTENGYQAQWNDDFHHVMRVLLVGQTDGYYEDYATDPIQHLGRALTEGFSYQGQESKHRRGMFRGTRSGHLPPVSFVNFLQNHDQVGNSPYGRRLSALASPESVRLGAAVLLLSPGIPMLFMGEEWGASTPFDFFCDYQEPIASAVRNGRRDEFKRFEEFRSEAALSKLSDPIAAGTKARSTLNWAELAAPGHASLLALHLDLLAVRSDEIVPLLARMDRGTARATRLSDRALEARWTAGPVTLVLAANFSDSPVPYDAPSGRTVFALGARHEHHLAAWGFHAIISDDSPLAASR